MLMRDNGRYTLVLRPDHLMHPIRRSASFATKQVFCGDSGTMPDSPILVINTGSSSLKLGLFIQGDDDEQPVLSGSADSVGTPDARLQITKPHGEVLRQEKLPGADQQKALTELTKWLNELGEHKPQAVGHRVVH